jgi:integrase
LAQPVNAKAALRYLLNRKDNKTTPYLGQQAQLLRTISRHWIKTPADDTAALRGFASGLAIKRGNMVEKNRTRLRQLDLPANLNALLLLPARVLREIKRADTGSRIEALRMMLALAVEFLIVAPMRAENLVGIEIDRHIVEIGRGRIRNRHIVIPAHETKTNAPFEMTIPQESCALLDAYLNTYRARLAPLPAPWLFPDAKGKLRSTAAYSKAISDFIYRETGIRMNVHLFRHLAAKVYLDAHPDDIETVRRILGHKSTSTTLRSYAELRTDHAFRRYNQTITALRDRLNAVTPAQSRPKGSGDRK